MQHGAMVAATHTEIEHSGICRREIYQERERLKESRNLLLTAAASQPSVAQPMAGAAPGDGVLQQEAQHLQQSGVARLCAVRHTPAGVLPACTARVGTLTHAVRYLYCCSESSNSTLIHWDLA
jgi:hypothetical protein